jgi:hypothetical protein
MQGTVLHLDCNSRLSLHLLQGSGTACSFCLCLTTRASQKKQRAWVISMAIGASGVLAYRKSPTPSPVGADGYWKITNTEGRYAD